MNTVTGGRSARSGGYNHLAWTYQDSGILGALMCGALNALERLPADGVRGDQAASDWLSHDSVKPPPQRHDLRGGKIVGSSK